jgi:DnaJ-domain-containing protein 1
MTDHFALLNEARRPWIEPDSLKEKFLALSAQFHPDRFHESPVAERQAAGERYSAINAAYNCLREPRDRWRHLLELELGAKPVDIQGVPAELTDEMFEIGKLCREADAFIAEKKKVTSPVLKVQWFERGQAWTDKLSARQKPLNAQRDELLRELTAMNEVWEAASAPGASRTELPLERLDAIYRLLGYLGRWTGQLQERIVQLSL